MRYILFAFSLLFTLLVNAQDCHYYFEDDKKGHGDLWEKEISAANLSSLLNDKSNNLFVLQNGVLITNNSSLKKTKEILTLLDNYDFSVSSTEVVYDETFEIQTESNYISQYKIVKNCGNKDLTTFFTLIVLK